MAFVSKSQADTIILKGVCIQKESSKTAASIFPGHLVELTTGGLIRKQATAGADCRRAVAIENAVIGSTKNTEYDGASENVFTALCPTGVEAQIRVAANAAVIAAGDALMAAGDGTVAKHSGDNTIIAFALEALDNSNTATESFLIAEIK